MFDKMVGILAIVIGDAVGSSCNGLLRFNHLAYFLLGEIVSTLKYMFLFGQPFAYKRSCIVYRPSMKLLVNARVVTVQLWGVLSSQTKQIKRSPFAPD
jgi:hypothetical protein